MKCVNIQGQHLEMNAQNIQVGHVTESSNIQESILGVFFFLICETYTQRIQIYRFPLELPQHYV